VIDEGMNTEHWWKKKTEVLRDKPVPLSLCPPRILRRLPWDQNQASKVEKQ